MYVLIAYNDYGAYEGCGVPEILGCCKNADRLFEYSSEIVEDAALMCELDLDKDFVVFKINKIVELGE